MDFVEHCIVRKEADIESILYKNILSRFPEKSKLWVVPYFSYTFFSLYWFAFNENPKTYLGLNSSQIIYSIWTGIKYVARICARHTCFSLSTIKVSSEVYGIKYIE